MLDFDELLQLIIRLFTKNKKMSSELLKKYQTELFSYVLKMEGGLSDNKSDTADKLPRPKELRYHTNKGVTWETFLNNAKVLGYLATIENFLKMPMSIWSSIFSKIFLSKGKKYGENEIINNYISLWYWGGWYKPYMPESEVNKVLKSSLSDKTKLAELVKLRIKYFDKIIEKNSKLEIYRKGWTNRANEYYKLFSKYL